MEVVLITGGAGYIGSHAAKYFLEKGDKVVVFDNLSRGYKQVVELLQDFGDLTFVKGDLINPQEIQGVFDQFQVGSVLHFAALCSVNESMEKPELYFKNNICGTLNLLEAIRLSKGKGGLPNLVFSSTCATYGETQYVPVDEKHPQDPTNPYGESKYIVEKMIKWYSQLYKLNAVILRYFNVCGADPSGVIGDSKKPSALLVQNAVRGALGIEPFKITCPKVDTPDGTPIRDYVDVVDLIEAHHLAVEYLKEGGASDVFNIGTGKGSSVLEVVKTVERVLGVTIDIPQGETRKGEYAQIYASFQKAKSILDWEPKRQLEDSVLSLKKWYDKNPQGFDY